MGFIALLDANALHPIAVCDVLLRFAETPTYRMLWSDGGARSIVTSNVRHFPAEILDPLEITAQTPDEFLVNQWWLSPADGHRIVESIVEAAGNPPLTRAGMLDRLQAHLPEFVALARVSGPETPAPHVRKTRCFSDTRASHLRPQVEVKERLKAVKSWRVELFGNT